MTLMTHSGQRAVKPWWLRSLAFILFTAGASSSPEQESIVAQGLIGSRFGVPGVNATFDYVVVGGGTAGLTTAVRLAEDGTRSVAVIEAGGFYELDNGNLSSIPVYAPINTGSDAPTINPRTDWGYRTEPQTALFNRRLRYAQGKTLGGSSGRNFMVYHRGTEGTYQAWANLVDDQSYAFDSFRPYFEKSITLTSSGFPSSNGTTVNNGSSGGGGPLQVSFPAYTVPFSAVAEQGLRELGLPDVPDFISGRLLGSQYTFSSIDPNLGTRSSSETSFLRSALRRNNKLVVYQGTLAKKILFDVDKKATGVAVETAGLPYVISASREIIVSAGAYRSPQMLMVSGIGPEETLQRHNIPVVAARPGVGQNMWDHVGFAVISQVNITTHQELENPAFAAQATQEHIENQRGMLTSIGTDYLGWEKLPATLRAQLTNATLAGLATFPADWPELEWIIFDGPFGVVPGASPGLNYVTAIVALVAPLSRGNVTIASADTTDNPVINPNFLLDPRDQEIALQAVRRVRQLGDTSAVQSVLYSERVPGQNITTDAQLLEWLKNQALPIYHPSTTCAMGKLDDPMAVVDSKARVIGVKGLRVVDASSMPLLPPGHPQATIYALAEKISDLILRGE